MSRPSRGLGLGLGSGSAPPQQEAASQARGGEVTGQDAAHGLYPPSQTVAARPQEGRARTDHNAQLPHAQHPPPPPASDLAAAWPGEEPCARRAGGRADLGGKGVHGSSWHSEQLSGLKLRAGILPLV